jgi:hypothetical protein
MPLIIAMTLNMMQVNRLIARQIEHESAEVEACALGLEAEAKQLWRERCAAASTTFQRPPTLRQCVGEILRKGRPTGPVTAAELKSIKRKQPCP